MPIYVYIHFERIRAMYNLLYWGEGVKKEESIYVLAPSFVYHSAKATLLFNFIANLVSEKIHPFSSLLFYAHLPNILRYLLFLLFHLCVRLHQNCYYTCAKSHKKCLGLFMAIV